MVPRDGPVRGDFREATRLGPGVAPVMGQITERVAAYRDGEVSFEDLCVFLADFPYKACPPFGIWQLWGGGHALDGTMQEMRIAAGQLLTDDEFVALMTAIKSRWHAGHQPGDDHRGGNGGQPAAE